MKAVKQKNSEPRLMADERKQRIIELLQLRGRLTVEELVETLRVSAMTVRADLDALADSGLLLRSRGGALKPDGFVPIYPLAIRENFQKAEKQRIAKAAAELVRPNQTIVLDSGSTTMEMARRVRALKVRPLTVITNSLQIATELAGINQVSVVLPGGILRPDSYSMIGPFAERTLRELSADQAFLGVDGLDPSYGLCTTDILGSHIDSLMIQIAREVTVIADSTKIGRRGLSVFAKVSSIHRLITDSGANRRLVEEIRAQGVTVQLV